MALSRFHRVRQRRAEREPLTAHGRINLVPLIDVLTSIVFFSLLTYTGAVMANLASFDLTLPPVMVTGQSPTANAAQPDTTAIIIAVRIQNGKLRLEHSGGGGFVREFQGVTGPALDSLQALLVTVKQQYPDNNDVYVVPDDAVAYDDIVHVIEHVKLASYKNISLGSPNRGPQVSATSNRTASPASGGTH